MKDKLAARHAELAAQAKGRVVQCHSAAELSAALTAATTAHQLTVVDFTASWCGPCKHVAPIFGQLSLQHPNIQFVKVDVDECDDVSAAYEVEAMPTFVFLRDGGELRTYRTQGANVKGLTRAIELLSAADASADRSGSNSCGRRMKVMCYWWYGIRTHSRKSTRHAHSAARG